jgi:hypothetical protein
MIGVLKTCAAGLIEICSFQAAFLLRGAGSEPRDRNNDGGSG